MGSQLGAKCESLTANAPPIITGTAAPVRVFGLEANIHARKEFVFIVSAILIIVSQRYLRPLRLTKKMTVKQKIPPHLTYINYLLFC